MTSEQQAALCAELAQDPEARSYAAHLPGDPQRVVDLFTAEVFTKLASITAGQALTWAAAGPLAAITDASNDINSPLRSSCLAFLLRIGAGQDIDLGDPKVKMQFDIWKAQQLITEDAYNSIILLATGPASRADILGIPTPSGRDILDAWEAQ
jgi:hypothetical protein